MIHYKRVVSSNANDFMYYNRSKLGNAFESISLHIIHCLYNVKTVLNEQFCKGFYIRITLLMFFLFFFCCFGVVSRDSGVYSSPKPTGDQVQGEDLTVPSEPLHASRTDHHHMSQPTLRSQ